MNDEELKVEIENARRDHQAFSKAMDAIRQRLFELEGDPQRRERFITWAGTQAAMNVLIMCEVRCRGMIEDLQGNIEKSAEVIQLHLVSEEKKNDDR